MKLVSTAHVLYAIFILWIRKFGGGGRQIPRAESKPICLIIARLCAEEGGETQRQLWHKLPHIPEFKREKDRLGLKDTATTPP